MKNFGKQTKQFKQFYQGTGFGKQTTVGFYTQKFHNSLLSAGENTSLSRKRYMHFQAS